MKVRFFVLFLATGLLLCGLAGCGGRELHQRLLIQAIGIDTGDQGVAVTVRAASTGQEEGDQLYTCQGATVPEALSSLTLSTGREPFYAHCSLVVLGRSCGTVRISGLFPPGKHRPSHGPGAPFHRDRQPNTVRQKGQ